MEPSARRRRDLLTAVVLLAFSAVYLFQTFGYSPGSDEPGLPTARTLPFLLTGVLVLLSLALLWQARSSPGEDSEVSAGDEDARAIEEPSIRRLGLLLVMMIVYLVVMPFVGFLAATIVFGTVLQVFVFRATWVRSILLSVFIVGLAYWLFAVFLGVPL